MRKLIVIVFVMLMVMLVYDIDSAEASSPGPGPCSVGAYSWPILRSTPIERRVRRVERL